MKGVSYVARKKGDIFRISNTQQGTSNDKEKKLSVKIYPINLDIDYFTFRGHTSLVGYRVFYRCQPISGQDIVLKKGDRHFLIFNFKFLIQDCKKPP